MFCTLFRSLSARSGAAVALAALVSLTPLTARSDKVNVAHRGASAYAPEHTLAAYRLAIEQGADYVEQDLALTKDGALICLHDESLERTTNVEEVFPDRATSDAAGRTRWLAADFTLAEIRRLDAGSWFGAAFAGQRIPTWDEAVALVRGRAGMYPELKAPAMYTARSLDMVEIFARAVRAAGGDVPASSGTRPPLVLQSFDERAVRGLAVALPRVPRTFLVGDKTAAARWLSSAEQVREIASFATGIGPAKAIVEGQPQIVTWAHAAGLTVTPWTFRSAQTGRFADVQAEMRFFLFELGVDALFTDNPDKFPRK